MQILRAKIQNIFSIGEIDINLASRGLTLVSGYSKDENDPNGSGKSSLAHKAITWGLWGETVIGAKADKVIKAGEKKASVEIDFLGRDGTAWRVNRSRNPNKLRLRSIHLDTGEPIEDHSCKLAKETQEKINVCLGRDFQTWVQTDFFGQGRKLAFPELTPAARYKVLEEILPIEEISEWVAYTREQKNKMERLLENTM
jgi:DNA repair exonuclease SbcCD ATPase subunit